MVEGLENRKKSNVPFLRQCFLTASVAINIAGHGCVIGFSAILLPALRLPESPIQVTPSQESWIASILGFALICGNLIIMTLVDNLGRKKSHILTTLPILSGWFVLLLVKSVYGIILARFLQGVSMGMLGPLGSVIIAEMTDPKNRGAFLTTISLSLTIGVLLTHAIGSIVSWQQTGLICSFVTFISLVCIIFAKESPSWLISKGRFDEAREVFKYMRGDDEEQIEELETMITAQKMVRKASIGGQKLTIMMKLRRSLRYFNETYKKPEFYKPILIMFHLYTMFQFAGINVISSYATDIIKEVVGPEANAKFLMVALDVERLISNLCAMFLMRTMKRRTLLFTMSAICLSAYFGKALYVYLKEINMLPFESQWLPIALIGLYMFSLAVGISSVPFAISGEIFPLEYRGLAGGISVLPLSLNFFVAVKSFPVLKGVVGLPLTYCIYAGVVIYCLSVVWFMLPETKDRTLQEIEDTFRGGSKENRKAAMPLNENPGLKMRRSSSQHIVY